jgi:L-lactate dehydrogenase complex protein LldE
LRISLFIPCFVDQLRPEVGIAMVRVLERLGLEIDFPAAQTCCGQPAYNAGFREEARHAAEAFVDAFDDAEIVAVPSGSCAAMLKVFYRDLFRGEPLEAKARALGDRTFEFSQLLVERLGVTDVGARFEGRVTYHDGCHGLRELGIRETPRRLLREVRGLEIVEMSERDSCCGFGGVFSVKFPEISTAMAEVKGKSILATGVDGVVSGDPSCLLQIGGWLARQGYPLPCLHLAEVLERT